jgi:hypothetical protein
MKARKRKRERARCSSLVDWPVYLRLRGTMQGSECARNSRVWLRGSFVLGVGERGRPPFRRGLA